MTEATQSERYKHRGPVRYRDPHPWEVRILVLLSEQVAIPMDILAGFLKLSYGDTMKLMEEFKQYRWVGMERFIAKDEVWVWLRQPGVEHAATGFRQVTPSMWGLAHRRAMCAARLELETRHPNGEWVCERSLWEWKALAHHIPDGLLKITNAQGKGEVWAIEAELTPKTYERYVEIAIDRSERYDRLVYFCSPRVMKLLKRIPAVMDNPKIQVEEFFQEPYTFELFQWDWTETSGPGEVPPTRHPEAWEVEILKLIAEQGGMPVDQLARFLKYDYETAQKVADYLDVSGFLMQGRGPVKQAPWLWVTKVGGRLAGTGLKCLTPSPATVEVLRLRNEARLHVLERSPDVHWWSTRLLRIGAEDPRVPMAIVEDAGEQHAVEIEYARTARKERIAKYDRRCEEFDAVAVFCSSRRVKSFEELKEERGWENFYVQPFSVLDQPVARRRSRARPLRLTPIALEELPPKALRAVQEKEKSASLPSVESVGRYSGRGFARWRVVTDRKSWHVMQTPHGWYVRPTDALDEPKKVAKERKKRPAEPKERLKGTPRKLAKMRLDKVPAEALEAIRAKARLPETPTPVAAKQRLGGGFAGLLIKTADGKIWKVTYNPQTEWIAKEISSEAEVERPDAARQSRWPKDPPHMMRDVESWALPVQVLETIQETGQLSVLPNVLSAQQRKGPGALRWRIVTDRDTWRVTKTGEVWSASLSE